MVATVVALVLACFRRSARLGDADPARDDDASASRRPCSTRAARATTARCSTAARSAALTPVPHRHAEVPDVHRRPWAASRSPSTLTISTGQQKDKFLDFTVTGARVTFVGIKGGVDTALYDYRSKQPATADKGLHATLQSGTSLYNISNTTFCLQPAVGSISGRVFNDANGNGDDNSESGLVRTVRAYLGSATTASASTTSAADGSYTLSGLAAGTYRVCSTSGGWVQTAPKPLNTSCTGSGEGASGASVALVANGSGSASFGFYQTASISGSVVNGGDASGLARTVNLYVDGGSTPAASTTSAAGGGYTFPATTAQRVGLAYKICVVPTAGWQQTAPTGTAADCSGTGEAGTGKGVAGTIASGGSTATTIQLVQLATVSGRVFNDTNADGDDVGDPASPPASASTRAAARSRSRR